MRKIPSGTYYSQVYRGNDWNPTLRLGKGAFERDASFSKSDNYSDYIKIENSEYLYTVYEITLYSVDNGNMSSKTIPASEFFSN